MSEGYNGWTNYETWVVNDMVYLEEDCDAAYWRERAEELVAADPDSANADLADELKEFHEEQAPDVQGVFSDLLTAALGAVNWYEIAMHYTDEAKENAKEDEKATEDE